MFIILIEISSLHRHAHTMFVGTTQTGMRMNWLNLTLWGSFPEPDIFTFISSPKAQVSFSYRLSYVRPSISSTGSISNKLGTKHPWEKGFKFL